MTLAISPKITKSTAEVYKIRDLRNGNRADITIDDNGFSGRISIASSYGSFQNSWNACGKGFKKFLTELNLEYAADKFNQDRWLDTDETVRLYKQLVIDRRKTDFCDKLTARLVWDEIKRLEDETTATSFKGVLGECLNLLDFFDWIPDFCYGVSPQFKRFWSECWFVFIEEIKKEIN